MRLARLALLVLLPALAFGDDGAVRISVAVDETAERDVGYAIGVVCDEPEVVGAEMKTAPSGSSNILVLTGKRAGKTTCRAGTDPNRVSFVFEIVVTSKRAPGASRPGSRAG